MKCHARIMIEINEKKIKINEPRWREVESIDTKIDIFRVELEKLKKY